MKLTTRERQLLDAAATGLTDRQIGEQLNISFETVSSYWRGIRLKFQASSRTECVARYSQQKSEHLVVKHEIENTELQREIQTRTEAQANALAQKNMLEAITEASLAYIKGHSDLNRCFDSLLQDVLNLTHSEYGFIGEVVYRDGAPYLLEHGLTNISWSEEMRRLYDRPQEEGVRFKDLNTLFGAVLVSREIVIANESAIDRRAAGKAVGHSALKAFIGIPVFSEDELIGMIGLANRNGGYSQEIADYLKPLIACCATFIIGHRLEAERASMLQRIADSEALARDIIALAPTGILYESLDRRVEIVNQTFVSMFEVGLTPDELVGRMCSELCTALNDKLLDPQGFVNRIEDLIARQEPADRDVLEFLDGRRFQREFLVMKSDGRIRGYLWRYRDITRKEFTRATDEPALTELGSHI